MGGVGKWRGMLVVLEVYAINASVVVVVELYLLHLFWRLTALVDSVIR